MTIRLRPYDRTVITNIQVRVEDMDPLDLFEAFRGVVQMLTDHSVSVFYVDGADGGAFYTSLSPDKVWFFDTEDSEWLHYVGERLENIYAGTASASSAMNAWKNSADHNTNMLTAQYTELGIGRAYSQNSTYGWYWTTTFGSR